MMKIVCLCVGGLLCVITFERRGKEDFGKIFDSMQTRINPESPADTI
jgi:hypothetical protein